ncbi:glutamine amidotransferase subunit [Savitreella phatthalungensis]
MCRLLIYSGKQPIVLADILTRPSHSIINQAFDSRLRIDTRRGPINGDGFGVGWYSDEACQSPTQSAPLSPRTASAGASEIEETRTVSGTGPGPCIFTSISPAWNNANLARLADKTRSRLIFGHVRASTAGVLAEVNCHPFQYGRLMWMHNGGIAGWEKVKRRLQMSVREEYFLWMQGSTDSECAFALFLDKLHSLGRRPLAEHEDTDASRPSPYDAKTLRQALLDTIAAINDATEAAGVQEPSLLNFAVTDGTHTVCSRYVSSRTDEAASLFFSSGTSFHRYDSERGLYRMDRRDKGQDMVLVSSEPLTFERADWVTVPTNAVLTIAHANVLLHPIVDKYYVDRASHVRNDRFAASKGLLSTSSAIDGAEKETGEVLRAGSLSIASGVNGSSSSAVVDATSPRSQPVV